MAAYETTVLDVRVIAPRDRHPRILADLWALAPEEALELLVDHDPVPLRYQLEAEQPGCFDWAYLEEGPETWRVRLQRRKGNGAQPEPIRLDNRGLEPPEPLARTLEAAARLNPDEALLAQMDREPMLLYPQLHSRGLRHETTPQADGSYQVRIWMDA
jgi:uncharacterized protein (DUF2249 family)